VASRPPAAGPPGPKPATAVELKARIEAERAGRPFLMYRGEEAEQQLVFMERGPLSIGRRAATDLSLHWDNQVSGLHAVLELVGGECTLVDDGLSRNGSYVNGERVHGRRRLRDGDMLRFGNTVVQYREPVAEGGDSTVAAADQLTSASLSDSQRRVLMALCRPFKDGSEFATPATNQQIADELVVSVDAVKSTLRALFEVFGVDALPQNQKRASLALQALRTGVITRRDL
jgi:pSer/pThr/pTyr-binding forkhead associated (FHA) protein